jgi:hypothetical protein
MIVRRRGARLETRTVRAVGSLHLTEVWTQPDRPPSQQSSAGRRAADYPGPEGQRCQRIPTTSTETTAATAVFR